MYIPYGTTVGTVSMHVYRIGGHGTIGLCHGRPEKCGAYKPFKSTLSKTSCRGFVISLVVTEREPIQKQRCQLDQVTFSKKYYARFLRIYVESHFAARIMSHVPKSMARRKHTISKHIRQQVQGLLLRPASLSASSTPVVV